MFGPKFQQISVGISIPTGISGTDLEEITNIPIGRNRNRYFYLTEISGIFGSGKHLYTTYGIFHS